MTTCATIQSADHARGEGKLEGQTPEGKIESGGVEMSFRNAGGSRVRQKRGGLEGWRREMEEKGSGDVGRMKIKDVDGRSG
jgi:hypothetical protein